MELDEDSIEESKRTIMEQTEPIKRQLYQFGEDRQESGELEISKESNLTGSFKKRL